MKEKILTFLPVFYVYIVSLLITLNLTFYYSLQTRISIIYFLGFFSLIFGVLKLVRYRGFVESLREYDVISQKIKIYAYIYPFFEIIFGVLFILQKEYLLLEYICLGFFLANLVSVTLALEKRKKFYCACMGGLFKLPLSYVSLVENLTMIIGLVVLIYTR